MHFGKHLVTLLLACGLSASVIGCGFHLRGSQSTPIAKNYPSIQLALSEEAEIIKKPLTVYLTNLGAKVDQPNSTTILRLQDYQQKRQLFSGKLTEVQLRISATFTLENNLGEPLTAPRTVVSQRSYQYDIASVNTERQEETYLLKVMQDDIAQQITRQLHANRLPYAQVDEAP